MSHIHYLTVQDVLWINQKVTSQVNPFEFATLEEATFYQYSYGAAAGPIPQAGRFLAGFLSKRPFSEGNEVTAFIACAAFLKMNGHHLDVSDAASWIKSAVANPSGASAAVAAAAKPDEAGSHTADPRSVVAELLCVHEGMIKQEAVSARL